jgi:hypothetical protein
MEYKKLIWQAWHAYYNRNLMEMTQYLEQSMEHTPLSRVETVLHWIQSFAQLTFHTNEEKFNANSLIKTEEWQKLLRSIALGEYSIKPLNLLNTNNRQTVSAYNHQESIAKYQSRNFQQKYQQILSAFPEDFREKNRILCLMLKMNESEILEAILTVNCKAKQKDFLPIVVTDCVNLKLFKQPQTIVEYFPLNTEQISGLSEKLWLRYFSNRVASLFYEWSPKIVIDLKNEVQRNIFIKM